MKLSLTAELGFAPGFGDTPRNQGVSGVCWFPHKCLHGREHAHLGQMIRPFPFCIVRNRKTARRTVYCAALLQMRGVPTGQAA